jgi:hypothetical protein
MDTMRNQWLIISLFLLFGCAPGGTDNLGISQVKEGLNSFNNPGVLGIRLPLAWDDYQGPTEYRLDLTPWTDTYWPTYLKGMAYRYRGNQADGLASFDFGKFLDEYLDTVRSDNVAQISRLSPAEKHDLLRGFNEDDIRDIRDGARDIQRSLDFDLGVIELTGVLTPSERRQRKIDRIKRAIGEVRNLITSRRMASQLPLVADSWARWAQIASQPGNRIAGGANLHVGSDDIIDSAARDWSWEGHCHGWAPAAIYAEEPKHAVLARSEDGKQILFTEGDIRGLLTKAWSDQSPDDKMTFIGGRCNVNDEDIIKDQYGRSLDAKVKCTTAGCGTQGDIGIHIETTFTLKGYTTYSFSTWNSNAPTRYLLQYQRHRTYESFGGLVFNSLNDIKTWLDQGKPVGNRIVHVDRLSQCRDINPVMLHLLFTKIMPQEKSFVIDITRSFQVWNQPMVGFKMKYVRIPGSTRDPDEPTPISEVSDNYWRHRTPGTRYLLNVTANLLWTKENGPRSSYKFHFEGKTYDIDELTKRVGTVNATIYSTPLDYTLELDKDQNIIGGEWGHVPTGDQSINISGKAPDFVFMFSGSTEPINPNGRLTVDYDNIVKKLHDCSLSNGQLTSSGIKDEFGQDIRYSVCNF